MQGLKLEECLESAYNVIAKRTGKMINGQFVKDDEGKFSEWDNLEDIEVKDAEEIKMKDIDIISGTESAYIKNEL